MAARILVAYASKKGSTAEIARAIGDELEKEGLGVMVADMKSVTSLEQYDALVIGTPVYAGKFLQEFSEFVARYREGLGKVPVAGFVTGLAPVYPKAGEPEAIAGTLATALAPAQPVAVTMFAGKYESGQQGFIVRSLGKVMKIPEGDFRDWNAIAAWARGLPEKMGIRRG